MIPDPLPAQERFWKAKARHKGFIGGVGSGKTLAGCVEIIRQPAQSYGAVLAPTYPMLRDATQRTFFELFRPFVLEHSKSENITMLRNGTVVYWRSADQPDRLRGPNLNWFYLDEADYMDADIWDVMLGRIRRDPSRCWVTTTPDGITGRGWVRNKIYKKAKAGNKDYAIITARTHDNIHLPAEYIRTLEESYTTEWARQELYGEFIDALGKVMRREWLQNTHAIPDDCQFTIGVDLASSMKEGADDRAIVVVGKSGTTYYVVEVIYGKWSFNETKQQIIAAADRWQPLKVCVEKVAYQEVMVEQLKLETMHNIQAVSPKGRDKLTRFGPVAGKYEYRHIKHVYNLPVDFTEQLLMFDGSPRNHDDMVDALVYAVNGHESGTYVYEI